MCPLGDSTLNSSSLNFEAWPDVSNKDMFAREGQLTFSKPYFLQTFSISFFNSSIMIVPLGVNNGKPGPTYSEKQNKSRSNPILR